MAQVQQEGVLRTVQLSVLLHPHLLPGHAPEDPRLARHVGPHEHRGQGRQVLATLHAGRR